MLQPNVRNNDTGSKLHMNLTRSGAGGWLTIDLAAIDGNYRRICEKVSDQTSVGAAVKADAYGLGVTRVAPVLCGAGCRHFFVATVDEALELRPLVAPDAQVFQLNGPFQGCEAELKAAGITPVLNSPEQVALWAALSRKTGTRSPCVIQIDSGMSRFGLDDVALSTAAEDLKALDIQLVMSHLACADEPQHGQNSSQRETFLSRKKSLTAPLSSLAASSGIFLGADYHFDLVRPGYALYGGNPTPSAPSPMLPVVTLQVRMIQERRIEAGATVGYSARFVAQRPTRIATLAAGYADGLPRAAGGRTFAVLPEKPDILLPVIGRVSMDCLALDITALGDLPLPPGTAFEFIGPHRPLDAVAKDLDMIGYELLTGLSHRYHRDYIERVK